MDMRLLWTWSNDFVSHLKKCVFVVLICAHFGSLLFSEVGLAAARVNVGKMPASALVELQWSDSLHGFEGTQYIVLPRSQLPTAKTQAPEEALPPVDLDFWILPNRDLQIDRQRVLTREQQEFIQANSAVEWPLSDIGLGAVTVRRVDMSESDDFCSGDEAWKLPWEGDFRWSSPTFERREFERVLRVNVFPKRDSRCLALRILFEFIPREGIGNFAMQGNLGGTLSGPVHLLFKTKALPTMIRFRDQGRRLQMSCLRCAESNSGWSEVAFHALPPVLDFHLGGAPARTLSFAGTSEFKLASTPQSAKHTQIAEDVMEVVKYFQPAVAKLFADTGTAWIFRVKPEVLIENMLIGQPGEIQLGAAYGEFGLFLDSFQQAALFREVARNFIRHAIQQSSKIKLETWHQLEERERWARLIAEIWVTEFYPDLFKIKKLAGKFSYLPFFKDLESGKALLNNNIFMGAEETGSGPDFHFMNEFFLPMTGAEMNLRMRSCAAPQDYKELIHSAVSVAQGLSSVQEFMTAVLSRRKSSDCSAHMQNWVFPHDVVSESVRVDNLKDGITLSRKIDAVPVSKKFLLYADKPLLREKISVEVKGTDSVQRLFLPELIDARDQSHSLGIEKPLRVSVVSPVRSSTMSHFVWPRPVKFVLQAVSLNYDSRKNDVSAKSQASFFQEGDDWDKSVSLGYKRLYSKNFVNLQFSSRVPSLISQFESSISIQSNVELTRDNPAFLALTMDSSNMQTALLYPEGVSFQASFRRPLSLSAYAQQMTDPDREFVFGYSLGLAPRLTWKETLTYGASDQGIDVGLRDLPAWPEGEFFSKEYGLVRSEIFHTLAHNHVVPLLRTVIFQHAVLYASHVITFDSIESLEESKVGGRTAQSVSAGVRLYGALLGAKNQSLSLEVARGLSEEPKTSYSVNVGRSIN